MGDKVTFISPQDLISRIGTRECPILFDVRRAEVFETAADMVPGASWRDPAKVEAWSRQIPARGEVIVYCVHGHEVSQGVADSLRHLGRFAAYLKGGIEGYRAAGGATIRRPAQAD